MRNPKFLLAGAAGIALGLFLGGCDSADPAPTKPEARKRVGATDLKGGSEFDRDLIAAKRAPGTLAERDAAVRVVLARYGVEAAPVPVLPQESPEPSPAAAAKTASTFTRVVSKFYADNDIHTFYKHVKVPPGGNCVLTATANSDGADPYVVAFYREDPTGSATGYPVKIINARDDISPTNRNCDIAWTNTATTTQDADIVVFNYLPACRGTVNIRMAINGNFEDYSNRYLGGAIEYASTDIAVPSNCSPSYTRVTGTVVSGGGYSEAALVVDAEDLKGGIFWDGGVGSQSVNFAPLLHIGYPSFGLIFEATTTRALTTWSEEAATYLYTQKEVYSCR